MSTTSPSAVDHEPLGGVTPVRLDAATLDSTAPEYLRDLKRELGEAGCAPVELAASARFEDDCPFAAQSTADRVRNLVRAASLLGANRLALTVEDEEASDSAETALAACTERARKEGVHLEIDGLADSEH
jgi:DNA-directed RNA polymerase specialized sigma24 family protein